MAVHRQLIKATILGLAALAANLFAPWNSVEMGVTPGNLFVFVATIAFGLPGGAVAAAVGTVPVLFLDSDPVSRLECLRTFFLTATIGASVLLRPRFPPYASVVAVWGLFIAPLFLLLAERMGADAITAEFLLFLAISDTILALAAGAALHNQRILCTLTETSRPISFPSLIAHVLSLCACASVFATMLMMREQGPALFDVLITEQGIRWVATFFAIVILAPIALSERLSKVLLQNFNNFDTGGMLTRLKTESFSGVATEHWRRQTATDLTTTRSKTSDSLSTTSTTGAKPLTVDEGICAINPDGSIAFANRRFLRLIGAKSSDVLGKHLSTVGGDATLGRAILALADKCRAKGKVSQEVKINALPDALRYFEVVASPASESEESSLKGTPDGIVVRLKDITHRRTIETHLLQAQKLDSLGTLLGGVVHQFNNALTAITGHASVALRSHEQATIVQSLQEIVTASQEAGKTARQLLDFADGRPSLMEDKDLGRVIGDRTGLLRRLVGEEYEVAITMPGDTIGVNCDTHLILQALTNLVLNAKESYRGRPGRIEVSLDSETVEDNLSDILVGARAGKFARLKVRDFGSGMSPDTLSRAFDPLFTTKASKGHAGLGLSIVYAIVRAHDGFLSAESHPEKGTTITLYFPFKEITAEKAVSSKWATQDFDPGTPTPQGKQEKILVVEDEPNVRDLVATMLQTLGYDVTTCANGAEALEKTAGSPFDLVIIDVIMPRMRGTELFEKMRQNSPILKTLLMTGQSGIPDSLRGTVPVLHKPFDLEVLGKIVRKTIDTPADAVGKVASA